MLRKNEISKILVEASKKYPIKIVGKKIIVNNYILEVVVSKWGYSEEEGLEYLFRATNIDRKDAYDYNPFIDSVDYDYNFAIKKLPSEVKKIYSKYNIATNTHSIGWFCSFSAEMVEEIINILMPLIMSDLKTK